jgi:heptosyltransferase-2
MNKILVIRLSSLGDVILSTPLLKKLREKYPHSQIDYCVKKEFSDALRFNPNINNIIEAENELTFRKLRTLKKRLKIEKYDLVIDAHNKLNTFYLRTFPGSKKLVFKKYSVKKFLLVKFKLNLLKNLPPISERYLKILSGQIYDKQIVPEIYPEQAAKGNVEEIIEQLNLKGRETICIAPSSGHFTKTYPPELYAELINNFDRTKYSFVLIGKGNDKANISDVLSKTGINVHDLCDKLDVNEIYELMKKCRLVIGGDTGPMHIAEAAGIPLILLAGSSVKEFGFYPQTENTIILENNSLKCRPCSHIGRNSCPKRHFKCMYEIKPAEIKNAVESLLLLK